jgi:FMN phosphatase YigB (HAD superfamily)
LTGTVYFELDGTRYEWKHYDDDKAELSTKNIGSTEITIGLYSTETVMAIKLLRLKVLFLDLGNTLVVQNPNTGKFAQLPQTDMLLDSLKRKGIEAGIISDGSRSMVDELLDDKSFLNRFRIVVMSGDPEVGGVLKPRAKIFDVALSKMSASLGQDVNPSETAFLTETVEHFKVYNLLYGIGVRDIISDNCKQYVSS